MSRTPLFIVLAFAVVAASPVSHAFGQAAALAEPAEPEVYTDPTVQALMSTNPETPQDLTNVILLLLDLKQVKPAKFLFTKLVGQEIDDAQLVALGKKVGRANLDRLSKVPEFQPQVKPFVQKIIAAMNAAARDPDKLAALIERLKEPSIDSQVATIGELRQGQEAAAQALLAVLLDPARADEHAQVRVALAGLGSVGIEPLGLISAHGTEAERIAALKIIGMTDEAATHAPLYAAAFEPQSPTAVRQAAVAALADERNRIPTVASAAAELYLSAKRIYLAQPRYDDFAPGFYWKWNTAAKQPVVVATPNRIAALVRAAQMANIAVAITNRDPNAVTLAQAASLEAAILSAKPIAPAAAPAGAAEAPAPPAAAPAPTDSAAAEPAAADPADPAATAAAAPPKPAVDVVGQWNVDMKPTAVELRRLLEFTAANDRSAEAAAVIGLLVKAEGLHALDGIGGRPSTLVKLVTHPDRRIRFAAMAAIVGLDPQQPFTGSSAVADALGYFASSTGERKALVADMNVGRARDVAGVFAGNNGARGEIATNARDAVRLVAGDPDVEAVAMYRPMMLAELGQLLAQYRADYRTARLPAFIYCEPDDVERTRSLVANDPLAYAIYQPRTLEMLRQQSGLDVTYAAAQALVPANERVAQAQAAITAIGHFLATNNKVFNLRPFEAALVKGAWSPATSAAAIRALSQFGSPVAQRTLADLAGATTWPIEVRKAAAEGFNASVSRYGTLLTTAEISRQYDRYNASATADAATQAVLGSLLDTIEARATKLPPRSKSGEAVKPVPIAPPAPAAKPQADPAAPPAEGAPPEPAPMGAAPPTP